MVQPCVSTGARGRIRPFAETLDAARRREYVATSRRCGTSFRSGLTTSPRGAGVPRLRRTRRRSRRRCRARARSGRSHREYIAEVGHATVQLDRDRSDGGSGNIQVHGPSGFDETHPGDHSPCNRRFDAARDAPRTGIAIVTDFRCPSPRPAAARPLMQSEE